MSTSPFMKVIDGLYFPKFLSEDNYNLMRNLALRSGDVITAVYPKCGTHWINYLLWSILHPEQDPPEGNTVREEVPVLELFGPGSWADSPEGQARTLSTHLPSRLIPNDARAKFVVVARNPFDCCVSYHKFFPLEIPTPGSSNDGKVPDSYLDAFLKGDVGFGDYFSFHRDWYERRNDENVHFVTYEQMKSDPRGQTLKLAKFLGASEKLEADAGLLLDKVVHQSSFDVMKSNVKYTVMPKLVQEMPNPEDLPTFPKDDGIPILRKGQVGGFRDSLSEDQVQRLRDKMEEVLAGTELLQQWRHL